MHTILNCFVINGQLYARCRLLYERTKMPNMVYSVLFIGMPSPLCRIYILCITLTFVIRFFLFFFFFLFQKYFTNYTTTSLKILTNTTTTTTTAMGPFKRQRLITAAMIIINYLREFSMRKYGRSIFSRTVYKIKKKGEREREE